MNDKDADQTLKQQSDEYTRTLALLRKVATTANSAATVAEAFQGVIDAVCDYLQWPVGHAYAVLPGAEGRLKDLDIWSGGTREHYPDLPKQWRERVLRPTLRDKVEIPPQSAWLSSGCGKAGAEEPGFPADAVVLTPVTVCEETVVVLEFYPPGGARRGCSSLLDILDQVGAECCYIIQRERMELKLLRQERGLAEVTRLATLGEMASSLAHQLNQPLTAITNYIAAGRRLVERGNDDRERLLTICQRVDEQARRASDYIEHMRAFARRHRQPRPQQVDVNEVLEESIALAEPASRSAGVAIRLHAAGALPAVVADPMQLQQAFVSLLMNAIEAMEEVESDRVVNVMSERADGVRVTVCDQGRGLPDEMLEQIFDPFFSNRPGGVGMGLAVSRSIIEAAGGSLRAKRVEPHGMAFYVDLPAAEC